MHVCVCVCECVVSVDGVPLSQEPYFPVVIEKIQAAIDTLGGRVVPKLNWSTPRVSHVTIM